MRQSSEALESIDTLESENTPVKQYCSRLQSKEDMVIGVILDVDEMIS